MQENPFRIIDSTEELPEGHKKEVMGSVKMIHLTLRLVQLFVGDMTSVFFTRFSKISKEKDNNS